MFGQSRPLGRQRVPIEVGALLRGWRTFWTLQGHHLRLEAGNDVVGPWAVIDSPSPEGVDDPSRGVDDERGGHRDVTGWCSEHEAVVPGGAAPVARPDRVENGDGKLRTIVILSPT